MKIYVLVGATSSGKDTIYNSVLNCTDNICKTISHTTRPMRECEQEGREYYFINDEEFNNMNNKDLFIEHRTYNTKKGIWSYGLTKEALIKNNTNKLVIVDFNGLKEIEKYCRLNNIELISFYVNTSLWNCNMRALKREPNLNDEDVLEINRRILSDYTDVLPAKKYCDYILDNNTRDDFTKSVLKISKIIENNK